MKLYLDTADIAEIEEAASWGVVGAVTGGDVIVRGARALDLEPTVAVLVDMGLDCDLKADEFVVRPSSLHAVKRITTGLWPAFPSDIVSLVTVMATQAKTCRKKWRASPHRSQHPRGHQRQRLRQRGR